MGNKDEMRRLSGTRQGKEPHFFREDVGNETMSFPGRGRGNTGGCTADRSISLTRISHSTGILSCLLWHTVAEQSLSFFMQGFSALAALKPQRMHHSGSIFGHLQPSIGA